MRAFSLLAAVLLTGYAATAQAPTGLRVTTGGGALVSLADILDSATEADVLVLGELHDDSTGHLVEQVVLAAALAGNRPVVLSLEMFETDVQTVLDEYLAGLVRERDFLAASRPWGNYETDYRPLVEAARQAGAPVVAANAPGRYVSLVSRRGWVALDSLSEHAWTQLPPSVSPPSDALTAKFTALMGGMSHGAGPTVEGMLAGQNLRDATMAWSIARALEAHPGALVVHVNGSFHSADRLGVPEHLAQLAPQARVVIVTMDRTAPTEPSADDFVIVTPGQD